MTKAIGALKERRMPTIRSNRYLTFSGPSSTAARALRKKDIRGGIRGDVQDVVDAQGGTVIGHIRIGLHRTGDHLVEIGKDVADGAGSEDKFSVMEYLPNPGCRGMKAVFEIGTAMVPDGGGPAYEAQGLKEHDIFQGIVEVEEPGAGDADQENGLADKISRENPFKIEKGLLDRFEVGKEDHDDETGDEPFQHDGEIVAGME